MPILRVIKSFFSLFLFKKLCLPKADVLTVANDADRPFEYLGKRYSPIMDSVEDRLKVMGVRCVSVSRLLNDLTGDLAYGDVYSPVGVFERALLEKRIRKFIARSPSVFSRLEYRAWIKILTETSVNRVVAILPSRELCCACHELGVWVADVQHGVHADSKEGSPYYWSGYRRIQPREWHPDAFLCWDASAKFQLEKWTSSFTGIELHVIGNPWLNRFLIDEEFVGNIFRMGWGEMIDAESRPTVLVTLQWGRTELDNGVIHESLIDVIKQTSERYRWLIRLHPNQIEGFAANEGRMFEEIFQNKLASHAEWQVATRMPLPLLLKRVQSHITWHSSVTIEAALMGVRTAVLNPEVFPGGIHEGLFDLLVDNGLVNYIEPTKDTIIGWINGEEVMSEPLHRMEDVLREYGKILRFIAGR